MSTLPLALEQDLDRAKEILTDPSNRDKAIIDVAFESGYLEIKTFNEFFRRETGMCPVEYRAFHTQFKRVTGVTPDEYRRKHAAETLPPQKETLQE